MIPAPRKPAEDAVCLLAESKPRGACLDRAFTLLELLAVIAIIAVLAALAIPVFRSVMNKGDQAKCMSHLKAFGQVFSLYASDNNMTLPWVDWASATFNPEAQKPNPFAEYWPNQQAVLNHRECPANRFPVSGWPAYNFARLGIADGTPKGKKLETTDVIRLATATHPSQLLLLVDAVPGQFIRFDVPGSWDTAVQPICVNANSSYIRHFGGVNALFADFHVEYVKWSQLDPATPEGQANRIKWLTIQ